jgi:TadE-like protein
LGQSTVEVAVSSIVLLLLMTGLLDLARVFFYSVDLHAAAREGARHGAWFNTAQRQNQYLDDGDIFSAVNSTLKGAGLNNATLAGGCPGTAPHNTPYPNASYPAPGGVTVYICYDSLGSQQGAGSCCITPPASDDLSWTGKDLNVVVLYNYPYVTGFLSSFLGPAIQVPANEHMYIQGHP